MMLHAPNEECREKLSKTLFPGSTSTLTGAGFYFVMYMIARIYLGLVGEGYQA